MEKGGTPYDDASFKSGSLRADLCQIATEIDYRHGARIVDAIMAQYSLEKL